MNWNSEEQLSIEELIRVLIKIVFSKRPKREELRSLLLEGGDYGRRLVAD